PVADAARSILDGHIVLTRKLAAAGHYPAIDVLDSKSRVKDAVTTPDQRDACATLLRCEASYREKEDLLLVGAYQKGSDPLVDAAMTLRQPILSFLRQPATEHTAIDDTSKRLSDIAKRIDGAVARATT